MAKIDLGNILDVINAVRPAVEKLAKDSKTSVETKDVPKVSAEVTTAVEKQIAVAQKEVNSRVDHLTNSEPWYQSRVTWGAIISILFAVLPVVGVQLDWIDRDTATNIGLALGGAVGGLVTLWGRYVSQKPIGE